MWLAIGLAAAGVLAIIIEVFVPAAGIIGIAGLGAIVASVVIVFQRLGNLIGSIYLAVVLVIVPVFIVLYFKFFPRSPVGRWLISRDRQDSGKGYASYTAAALLIHRAWPDVLVAMDSRNDVYGEALYREEPSWTGDLYRKVERKPMKLLTIRMIPYFAWANRGPAAMSVWLPVVWSK